MSAAPTEQTERDLTRVEKDLIINRIIESVARFEEALRQKDWTPLSDYLSLAHIWVKGSLSSLDDLEKIVNFHTRHVSQLRVIVETVLDSRIQAERAEFGLRVATVGVRTGGVSGDGVIMDVRIAFIPRDGEWKVDELAVSCPPEWAQWNNRPNARAPIQYHDPLMWDKK